MAAIYFKFIFTCSLVELLYFQISIGKTKCQSSLVNEFPWVAPLKGDTSKAYCTFCKKAFRIDESGKSQVSSHHKYHSIKDGGQNTKKKLAIDPNQQVFQPTLDGKISMSVKTSLPLNHAEQVCRAEIYQAFHIAQITLLLPRKRFKEIQAYVSKLSNWSRLCTGRC